VKISVFSLFRDSEPYLSRFFKQINEVEKNTNADFEYFFYENDSKDRTAQRLSKWCKPRGAKMLSETANEQSYGSTLEPDRMIKMARIRNKMASLGKPVNSDYSLIIDSDVIFNKNIVNDFLSFSHLNFSMLTPNVRQNVPCKMGSGNPSSYYDSLSLFDSSWNHCMTWSDNPFYEDSDRDKFSKGEPIKVQRSFGSLVLVKSEYFNQVQWRSSGNLEHWAFCDQLRSFSEIYFLPSIQPKVEVDQVSWPHENEVIERQRFLLQNKWNRFLLKTANQ
jgi:hypothetical protein